MLFTYHIKYVLPLPFPFFDLLLIFLYILFTPSYLLNVFYFRIILSSIDLQISMWTPSYKTSYLLILSRTFFCFLYIYV